MNTDLAQGTKQVERILSSSMQKIRDNNRKAAKTALNLTVQEMARRFKPEFERISDEFYNSYSPNSYIRRKDMGNILEITEQKLNDDFASFRVHYEAQAMPTRDGGGALLDLVFGEGFHGGGYSTKTPDAAGIYVTTPHYRTSSPAGAWSLWYTPAEQTEPSPYEKWLKWMHEYASSGEIQDIFSNYYNIEKNKYKILN